MTVRLVTTTLFFVLSTTQLFSQSISETLTTAEKHRLNNQFDLAEIEYKVLDNRSASVAERCEV